MSTILTREKTYVYGGMLVSVLATALVLWLLGLQGYGPIVLAGLSVPILIAITRIVYDGIVCVVLATWRWDTAASLARLDQVPDDVIVAIAIPTIVSSVEEMRIAIAKMEASYLATQHPRCVYCLLTDFADSARELDPEELDALKTAQSELALLRARHKTSFAILHRGRSWNALDGVWMGYERKRGKLLAFNRIILEGDSTPYVLVDCPLSLLRQVRFVLTLDDDSTIKRDAFNTLLRISCHPGNKPTVNARSNTVCGGHGVLQPTVKAVPRSTQNTRFELLSIEGHGESAPLDFHQIAFRSGSYYGKGIYEVKTANGVLHQRFPDNLVLTHDLLEGGYLKSAIVMDAPITEQVPPTLLSDLRRSHRWVRGDWQLLPWLRSTLINGLGREQNPLSFLNRWKIADNLRRTLTAPAYAILLISGVISASRPTILILSTFLATFSVVFNFFVASWQIRSVLGIRRWTARCLLGLGKHAMWYVFIISNGINNLHAIGSALWRLFVNPRRRLEWTRAGQTSGTNYTFAQYMCVMWPSCVAGLASFAMLWRAPHGNMLAMAVAVAWLSAPAFAWYLGRVCDSSSLCVKLISSLDS